MHVHYLEVITHDVDGTCAGLAATHGVAFASPEPMLGGARTATLGDGSRIGVRGPMHPDEQPGVRPYVKVDDLEAAAGAAEHAGAEILLEPMPLPGQGRIAIYALGGVQYGLWQV